MDSPTTEGAPAPRPRPFASLSAWAARLIGPPDGAPYQRARGEAGLLAAVVALGCALRWLGLRLGLPYFHHWDETLVTSSARGMIERGDDLPSSFFYGAPLMRLSALAYRAALSLGLPGSREAVLADEVYLRLVSRAVGSTLAASGTVAVYLLGRFVTGRGEAALFSALLYAVGAELVWHARFAVTDASVVALTAWALALAAGYARTRALGFGLGSVLLAGITFSFKLTGLATVVVPVGALVLLSPESLLGEPPAEQADGGRPPWLLPLAHRALLALAVPVVLGLFLALNPHVRDQWRQAFFEWEGIARHYREGHIKPFAEREPGLEHVAAALRFLATQALHTEPLAAGLVTLVAIAGLASLARQADLVTLLATAHAFSVVLAMALPNRAYLTRMYMPALPVLCLGFGQGLSLLLERLPPVSARNQRAAASTWQQRLALAAPVACVLLLAAPPLVQSVRAERLSSDARVRALDALAERARAAGKEITVAPTPAVSGSLALGGHGGLDRYLKRPGVTMLAEVATARQAQASGADFVLLASHRSLAKIWPYEEQWVFREVPGYAEVARFPYSPYEHRLDLVPTWDGRVTAVLLERR